MTDEPIPSLAEAMAEIRRLRERIAELEAAARRYSERIFHYAVEMGTLAQPTEDAPAVITHGHAPSAPPHDE